MSQFTTEEVVEAQKETIKGMRWQIQLLESAIKRLIKNQNEPDAWKEAEDLVGVYRP